MALSRLRSIGPVCTPANRPEGRRASPSSWKPGTGRAEATAARLHALRVLVDAEVGLQPLGEVGQARRAVWARCDHR